METADVVIAGAGIIGLSLALELASSGLRVTVLERGEAMRGSSWAAAGMLAGRDPENPPELTELSELSLRLYPEYLSQIESLSGKRVPVRTHRTLQAMHAERIVRALEPSRIQAIVPGVATDRAFLELHEQSLDPRELCAALPAAAAAAGVQIIEHTPVISASAAGYGFMFVKTPEKTYSAAHFVNCCGAWSGKFDGSKMIPVEPRKGQISAMRLAAGDNLPCALRAPEVYLVPRGDGRVIIGATVEHAGFDTTVSPDAIEALVRAAAALWPPVAKAEILDSWAGLRPGTPDDLPLLGAWEEPPCWIASGHFRNGIMLAPATARVMAQLIRGDHPELNLSAFAPARFGETHPIVQRTSDNYSTAAL